MWVLVLKGSYVEAGGHLIKLRAPPFLALIVVLGAKCLTPKRIMAGDEAVRTIVWTIAEILERFPQRFSMAYHQLGIGRRLIGDERRRKR